MSCGKCRKYQEGCGEGSREGKTERQWCSSEPLSLRASVGNRGGTHFSATLLERWGHNSSGLWRKAAAAKSLQPCPTLCDPIDGSPPGSPVPGILQARTLEWAAISFSNAWKGKVKGKSLSPLWLLATPWTAAHQAPPSMGFSKQEYWSGVPLPSPRLLLGNVNSLALRERSLLRFLRKPLGRDAVVSGWCPWRVDTHT